MVALKEKAERPVEAESSLADIAIPIHCKLETRHRRKHVLRMDNVIHVLFRPTCLDIAMARLSAETNVTFVRAPGAGVALVEPACQASAFLVVDYVARRYESLRCPPVALGNSIVGGLALVRLNGFDDDLRSIETVEIDVGTGAGDALSLAKMLPTSLLGRDGQILCYMRSLAVQCIRALAGQRKTRYRNSCSLRTVCASEMAVLSKVHKTSTQGLGP